ncbi:MAG TPA: alanine racemase [bacterium]|nr:alanine racemase [bacterium]HNS48416.1 alanine racemase [bacterium]
MKTRSWIEVNLANVKENLQTVRDRVKPSRILACVKANAYGLGAVEIARSLEADTAGFAVATVAEGLELRRAGIKKEILVLGCSAGPEEWPDALDRDLSLTIASRKQAEGISGLSARLKKRARVHLKVETGMNRLGVSPDEFQPLLNTCLSRPELTLAGIFTHLAAAETRNRFTLKQIELFRRLTERPGGLRPIPARHAANSAAVVNYPESYFELVRPGICLYGAYQGPVNRSGGKQPRFQPVASLKSRVVLVKRVRSGESIGYERLFRARRDTDVATVAIGYADGYARSISGRGRVIIRGKRRRILGLICMDMLMADVTGSGASVGDEVVLLGRQGGTSISAAEVADWSGGITHEFLSRLGPRLERLYFNSRTTPERGAGLLPS